jgi:glycerol-3-phosphate dehydrogenase
MRRQPELLEGRAFDLVVVGGGIVGACIAWDAAQRGLSVALIEGRDFGSGTSANSLKIIHGGLRHLQRLDLRTTRESIRERRTWLRIAPHLVEPLPVLVPDYGDVREHRLLLRAALLLNDLVSLDRNRGQPADRLLPGGARLTPAECRDWVPTLQTRGLRGGVLFYDAQMYSAERLVLEVVRAAERAGAVVLNYLEMVRARQESGGLRIDLLDGPTGERLRARASFLVNAAGPWLPATIRATGGQVAAPRYAAALNLVLPGRANRAALAVAASSPGGGQPFRRLFAVPWRHRTLIGTAHYSVPQLTPQMDPEPLLQRFLAEVNQALPHQPVRRDEVLKVHFGLLPVHRSGDATPSLIRRGELLEDSQPIISVASVKFTESRALAERVVDRVFARLGWSAPRCRTHSSRLPGAPAQGTGSLLREAQHRLGTMLDADVLEHLVRTYGND